MSELAPAASEVAERPSGAVEHRELGSRLRSARQQRDLSLRELARRIGVSASLISQIENGRVRPSVSTLMALVTELELSLDQLFSTDGRPPEPTRQASTAHTPPGEVGDVATAQAEPPQPAGAPPGLALSGLLPPAGIGSWSTSVSATLPLAGAWRALGVERPGSRAFLELESGVRWERLTPHSVPGMEFLYVRYEAGASSTAAGKHTRHQGIEFGYVTCGTLHITVGFDEVECGPESSVMFDASTPHRLENRGDQPAEAVWLIVGRTSLAGADDFATDPHA